MLRKYVPVSRHDLDTEPMQVKENLTYVEEHNQILESGDRVFCSEVIPLVRVQWRSHAKVEVTLETEESM